MMAEQRQTAFSEPTAQQNHCSLGAGTLPFQVFRVPPMGAA